MKSMLLTLVLFVMVTPWHGSTKTQAQYPLESIYKDTGPIINVAWSQDSIQFIFQRGFFLNNPSRLDVGVQTEVQPTWLSYDMQTEELTESDYWFLQPDLSDEQLAMFEIGTKDNQVSFIFMSPDQRYIAYATPGNAEAENLPYWFLGVADLETETWKIFEDIHIYDVEDFSNYYNVNWSSSVNAFMVDTSYYEEKPYYIRIEGSLDELIYEPLSENDMTLNGEPLYPWSTYDISSDGKKLLLQTSLINYRSQLVLWDLENPSASHIIRENISFSWFVTDQDVIVFIDETGLYSYDPVLKKSSLINPEINTILASGGAWLSPDGTKIAVYGGSGIYNLYIIDTGITDLP